MSVDISIGDFLLDNFLGPLLTDITNGALTLLGSSLGNLISLIGKRQDVDVLEFITDNFLNPMLEEMTTSLLSMLQQQLSLLSTSLISSLFGK